MAGGRQNRCFVIFRNPNSTLRIMKKSTVIYILVGTAALSCLLFVLMVFLTPNGNEKKMKVELFQDEILLQSHEAVLQIAVSNALSRQAGDLLKPTNFRIVWRAENGYIGHGDWIPVGTEDSIRVWIREKEQKDPRIRYGIEYKYIE